MKRVALGLLAVSVAASLVSAQNTKQPLPSLPFKLTEGQLDKDGLPLSGATLCLEPRKTPCFQMPASSPKNESPGFYHFGLEPSAKLLRIAGRPSWILFSATDSGGASGTLTRYAILKSQRAGPQAKLTNVLSYVALTNVSDHAIWSLPNISPYPILVTADFDWDMKAGETHFSKHRFFIEAWRFDPNKDVYVKAVFYKTTAKYDGGDDADRVDVVHPERARIIRQLIASRHQN